VDKQINGDFERRRLTNIQAVEVIVGDGDKVDWILDDEGI